MAGPRAGGSEPMTSSHLAEPASEPAPPRRWLRRTLLGLSAVAAVGAAGYLAAAGALSGEVLPGTRVAGVDIGGLSPASAEAVLRRGIADSADRPLIAHAGVTGSGGTRQILSPAEIGLSVDVKGTVADAGTGWPTPVSLVRVLFGGQEVAPRVAVDTRRLTARVAQLAEEVDVPVREGEVGYRGLEPRVTLPANGRALDQPQAARALRAAYPRSREPVPLPVRVVTPQVSAAVVNRVAQTTARTAVATPFLLKNGSREATLSREELAGGLRFVAAGTGLMRPSFDAEETAADFRSRLIGDDRVPRDASFEIVDGKPRVVPSRTGQAIDADGLGRLIAAVIEDGGGRTIEVPITKEAPRLTTAQARALGVTEQVSSFTTEYPCCAPRVTNIHRIAEIVNGHLVRPGETFSLNGLVGRRDTARGFVEAPMILNGRYVDDVGGGVSQFTTTMFNAVFFGGFQDVQHTPHSFYISRYPAGRESTISFPQPDFRWRNDSPYGVFITTSYTSTSVTVNFWSTKRFDVESESSARYNLKGFPTLTDTGPECIPMTGVDGFTIDVWRIFKQDDEEVRRQRFRTTYMPEPQLTCE
ncbi:VanW family protein [Planotetraspora phitsanulokensis]|uniref:Vanomycin resistance protein VanB n=1 Tax=Planotetraspora phitsanulokensis TaxID=575192 RepID=A0A8J3UBA6_9ACTN|nr:VanW family protein [Planotetraspora phitsanulokensis]GII42238.1 vanomycin resistance protein VanB [Planotetraspora phitsanulokensis]